MDTEKTAEMLPGAPTTRKQNPVIQTFETDRIEACHARDVYKAEHPVRGLLRTPGIQNAISLVLFAVMATLAAITSAQGAAGYILYFMWMGVACTPMLTHFGMHYLIGPAFHVPHYHDKFAYKRAMRTLKTLYVLPDGVTKAYAYEMIDNAESKRRGVPVIVLPGGTVPARNAVDTVYAREALGTLPIDTNREIHSRVAVTLALIASERRDRLQADLEQFQSERILPADTPYYQTLKTERDHIKTKMDTLSRRMDTLADKNQRIIDRHNKRQKKKKMEPMVAHILYSDNTGDNETLEQAMRARTEERE